MYLSWWNKKQAVFCVYKLRLNTYIVLSFNYLDIASGSLDRAMEQVPALKTQAYQHPKLKYTSGILAR